MVHQKQKPCHMREGNLLPWVNDASFEEDVQQTKSRFTSNSDPHEEG